MKSDSVTPFWIRSLQLYTVSVVVAAVAVVIDLSTKQTSFFHGYNWKVLCILGWSSPQTFSLKLKSEIAKLDFCVRIEGKCIKKVIGKLEVLSWSESQTAKFQAFSHPEACLCRW